MSTAIQWQIAKGGCGYNVGAVEVHAAYVNGVALFAFESPLSKPGFPFYSCVVTGQMSCGGNSVEQAKAAGEYQAKTWGVREADRRLSRKQFEALVENPTRLSP